MRDSKSVADTVRVNEADLAARAVDLLREASKSENLQLRERALFALSYVYLYAEHDRWSVWEWSNQKSDIVRNVKPLSLQYQAFAALSDFEAHHPQALNSYVSKCDEYIQFCKYHR